MQPAEDLCAARLPIDPEALRHFRFLDRWRNAMQALQLRGYLARSRARRERDRCADLIAQAEAVWRRPPDGRAIQP